MECCVHDPGLRLLERYLSGAREHLNEFGQLWICFIEDGGNFEKFREIADDYDWYFERYGNRSKFNFERCGDCENVDYVFLKNEKFIY